MSSWGVGLDKAQRSLQYTACFAVQGKLSFHRSQYWEYAVTAALLISLCTLAFAGDLTVPTPRMPQPSEISFQLHHGYLIIVEGRLGNLEHQNLLIDTGTSPSIIDRSVCEKLGLKGVAGGLSVFNKDLAAEAVTLPELQLGPVRRSGFPVMVADFSKIAKEVGTRVDAVIGLDVLGTISFTIDYQKNQILFHASPERHSASFTAGPQFIGLNLKTGGKELHLLLDTGTPRLVLFKDALNNLDYDWNAATGAGQNMSGAVSFSTVILTHARLGSEDVGPQAASVVASQKNADAAYDGLIGVTLLHPKQLSFDFDRHIMGWSN